MKAILTVVLLATVPLASAGIPENVLPRNTVAALAAPDEVIIYSLEPEGERDASDPQLHYFKILGQASLDQAQTATAIGAFKKAIADWDGIIAMCFDPRQAIRVTSNGHTYDFLLCYECHQLYVYEDDKLLKSLGVTGSPDVLNGLLTSLRLPLAKIETVTPEQIAAEQKRREEEEWRWLEATPKSIRPFWTEKMRQGIETPDFGRLRAVLKREFPDVGQRILALLKWYGSGVGLWSGYPAYEDIPEKLLLEFPTAQLVAATEGTELTEAQMEGAARLFVGWNATKRENDLKALPTALKKRLLEHSLKSTDSYHQEWAKNAFAEP